MKIRFKNGSLIETIDTIEEPKRGQRAKIYPVDDYKEPSVCDDREIGDGWNVSFVAANVMKTTVNVLILIVIRWIYRYFCKRSVFVND